MGWRHAGAQLPRAVHWTRGLRHYATRMTNLLSIYRTELRFVVRATLAAALSLVVSDAFGLPQDYWSALSALIIVQISLGGTIAAGLDRLAGTLAGAVVGAAVALAGQLWTLP